jgi:HAD superfamily hydrolase (TIGR01459 family)
MGSLYYRVVVFKRKNTIKMERIMTELNLIHLEECMDDYDLFLFDLWGVIIEGGETYPGVVEALNKIIAKKEVIFLSNAPRPDFIVARNLRNWGVLNVTPEMVLTSGDVARQLIVDYRKESLNDQVPKIFHLGSDRNDDILLEIDYLATHNINEADILLMSVFRDDHEDIHEFDDFLKRAAQIPNLLNICSNPDITIPKHGILRYCPGHFAKIIEQHGGNVIYTGKPETSIYDLVFQRKPQISKDRILMIGDTFETDILGANRSGIHSALVLSGNSVTIHKMYESLTDKLIALSEHAKNIDIWPTFVTQIS